MRGASALAFAPLLFAAWLPGTGWSQSVPLTSGTELGFGIYQRECTSCHGNPAIERVPTPEQLREMPPERIYAALVSGPMKAAGEKLSDLQKRQVSESLAGRALGTMAAGEAAAMPNRCLTNPPLTDPLQGPRWNGWGADLGNTRFQSADNARLAPDAVGKLTLKWVFGLPNATSSYAQPAVVSGRVFVGSDTGYIYSLDARSGCVYWSYQSKAGVRNAMTVAPVRGSAGSAYAVYYGDLKSNVYALDARTGKLLWTRKVDRNYTSRVTAAPAFHQGRLYVPVSSWEEFAAATPDYPCCKSVGSVVALNANNGRQIWKTYVIAERPQPVRKNSIGVQQWAPAGGSVWNTPSVDPKRKAVYFGTGDATTHPAALTSDAVLAVHMDTGKVLWSYQVHHNDSFLVGCNREPKSENCPQVQGPDWDIPSSVMIGSSAGRDVLVVGTKPGDILALDPDKQGQLLWRTNVSGPVVGDRFATPAVGEEVPRATGVLWGGAATADVAWFGLTGSGGLAAMSLLDGRRQWLSKLGLPAGASISHGAATTAIPGVIFVGGSDGVLRAASMLDGAVLWSFATNRSFDAVNKVTTRGGSITSAGAVVVDGMVFVGSGYGVIGGIPGNALLAFDTN
ncbi:MAG: PQQ-binding-like beta-propeller repeat protein [Pseudomonadota bacterium]